MKAFLGFFKRKSVIQCIGIIALCALVWIIGPWVAIAGKTPLLPPLSRLLCILCIIVAWVIILLLMLLRARQADQQLISELSATPVDPAVEALSKAKDDEVVELRGKFEDALLRLKQARARGRWDTRYLYELPWYVLIGAPGSGKTTALKNSGLTFPLSDRPGQQTVQGIGGTRNCDWFFTDEAIFIDTAGRYTTQDSHQPVDEAAWQGFLELIKRHRPRRPINGVLVTMSMADLLQGNADARNRNASDIRQRVQELYRVLNVRFPVYLLFTKCDLVAGFTDFFADLNDGARAQVWGETFDSSGHMAVEEQIRGFEKRFDELMQRLNQRSLRRIHEERDLKRRSQILDFPQQMTLLKSALFHFLSETFSASRFDTKPLLRGVYFTSGTQEGTPIDRVLGRLADAYGFDRQHQPMFSGRAKSFFITSLLKDVVIGEANLTGVDARIEKRRRWLQRGVFAGLAAFLAIMTALWGISYVGNKRAISRVNHQIDRLEQTIRASATEDDRTATSQLAWLEILKAANQVFQPPSAWTHLGLYQGGKLQSEINRAYHQLLTHGLLPMIQSHLEQRLRAGARSSRQSDPGRLYGLLRCYLMLGRPDKLEPKQVVAVLTREWEGLYARDPKIRSGLIAHTRVLLNDNHWFDPIVLDTALIAAVRRNLNSIPLSMQIYAHMKNEAFLDTSHDFHLADHIGRYGDQVFAVQTLRHRTIPGFYTRDGYTAYFKRQGLDFVRKVMAQNWVLENPAADQASDLDRLYDDLETLYFADYEKYWHRLLDALNLRRVRGVNETIQLLDILSSPDTPIRPLLEAVEANTALSERQSAEASADTDAQTPESAEQSIFPTSQMPVKATVSLPLRRMERPFEDLNILVQGDEKTPPPIDHVLGRLATLRDDMMMIGSSAKSDEQALRMATERMSGAGASDTIKLAKLEFKRLPQPLQRWFLSLTSFGWELTLSSAKSELDSIWKRDVLIPYRSGLDKRYPLFDSPYDATIADFSRFFAPNGTIDRYFQDHIRPFVDTSRSVWRQVAMDDQGVGLSRAVLQQFQNAARIRQSFFVSGAQTPAFEFELRPLSLDERMAAFRMNMEGQPLIYSHGPIRSTRFTWPGPDTDRGVRLTYQTLDGREFFDVAEGPWALFRILDQARLEATSVPDRFRITFQKKGYQARFELRASSADNPFMLSALKRFRCPEEL